MEQAVKMHFMFENDVKMYGTQTFSISSLISCMFENDVKMYGTQTRSDKKEPGGKFENDVKMYGTQTFLNIGIGC